jgi:membrane-bound metal-dependent hydrolase YbcI (DUF457 family)
MERTNLIPKQHRGFYALVAATIVGFVVKKYAKDNAAAIGSALVVHSAVQKL